MVAVTDYLLARIDILAYSELYKKSPELIAEINHILEAKNRSISKINGETKSIKLVCKPMYGDTIDIYCECRGEEPIAKMLIDAVSETMMTITREGLLARGAICRGELIDTDEVFTGKALVDAKEIEDNVGSATIGISDDVIKMVRKEMADLYTVPSVLEDVICSMFPDGRRLNVYHHCKTIDLDNAEVDGHSVDYSSCLLSAIRRYKGMLDPSRDNSRQLRIYDGTMSFHNECCRIIGLDDQIIPNDDLLSVEKT